MDMVAHITDEGISFSYVLSLILSWKDRLKYQLWIIDFLLGLGNFFIGSQQLLYKNIKLIWRWRWLLFSTKYWMLIDLCILYDIYLNVSLCVYLKSARYPHGS